MAGKKHGRLGDDDAAPAPAPAPKSRKKRSCETCAVVGPEATVQLCLRRTGKPARFVGSVTDVCNLMEGLETADRESFFALHLDVRNNIVDIDKVSTGSQAGVEVHPREVFKSALLSGAQSVIFVHNHPSGNPTASRQDQELTRRLKAVGELVGIPVRDHIIVGRDESHDRSCTSMVNQGLMGYELPKVK